MAKTYEYAMHVRLELPLKQRILTEACTQGLEKGERVTETDVIRRCLQIGLETLAQERAKNVNPA